MKKAEFVVSKVRFFLKEEDDVDDVIIYDLLATVRTATVVELARGKCLKEACNNWIASFEDINDKNFIDAINAKRMNEGLEALDPEKDPDIVYEIDDYVNSLSGSELFAALADGIKHYYVDWSKVPVCGS